MSSELPRRVGRYVLFEPMASGGTATVHLGRLFGPSGFARTVCIKRLHPQFAAEPDFVNMFLDEARICARIRHPNVVSILDVISDGGEVLLVMEYLAGEPLSKLLRAARERAERLPLRVAAAIARDLLQGLRAAHETCDEQGEPLSVVHRDVSPHNVLVGKDGVARVLDFGIAKARGRLSSTTDGRVKGKLRYMAPEQLDGDEATARSDIYAAGIVLWEMLTSRRLFDGDNEGHVVEQVLLADVDPPSKYVPDLPKGLDGVVMRALDREPKDRYATAEEMAVALEACVPAAAPFEVGAWISSIAGELLARRGARVVEIENTKAPDEEAGVASAGATGGGRRLRRSVRRVVPGLVGIALAGLVGVGVGARASSPRSSAEVPPAGTENAIAPPNGSVAPAEAPRTEQPTAAAATLVTESSQHHVVKPRAAHTIGPRATASATRASNPCNPPFRRDSAGVKVWKPECLFK